MTSSFHSRFRSTLAALGILLFGHLVLADSPESTLVFTVEEQADGSVKISARGTAYAAFPGNIINTPSDPATPSPPHTLASQTISPLPTGLFLTIPFTTQVSEEEAAPEEADPVFTDLPVKTVSFFSAGNWAFGVTESLGSDEEGPVAEGLIEGFVNPGAAITGSGSVTVNDIPFSNFVPGTYLISNVQLIPGEPEPKRVGYLFELTYEVIPFESPIATTSGPPSLSVSTPAPFPASAIGRTSRTQRILIKNTGKVPVTRLSVGISGKNHLDFRHRPLRVRSLKPGAQASVGVFFRPTDRDARKASFDVRGSAPAVSVPLSGEGKANSPRFPRVI